MLFFLKYFIFCIWNTLVRICGIVWSENKYTHQHHHSTNLVVRACVADTSSSSSLCVRAISKCSTSLGFPIILRATFLSIENIHLASFLPVCHLNGDIFRSGKYLCYICASERHIYSERERTPQQQMRI